ncbi:GyrI-like domain-containing protein [Streptomyces sp. NPDC003273]|uniref:GyrI-like domain-containing protein n=1 Tax=Streptomyces sp. NPDC003273 TaxID=3364678 RepID=UPI003678CDAD
MKPSWAGRTRARPTTRWIDSAWLVTAAYSQLRLGPARPPGRRGDSGPADDQRVLRHRWQLRTEAWAVVGSLPGGRVARLTHFGSFDGLGASWERLGSWIQARGLSAGEDRWETYVTQPSPGMDPRDLRTELNWPVTARRRPSAGQATARGTADSR